MISAFIFTVFRLLKNCLAFSAPPFSVGETLHIAYQKYKIKKEILRKRQKIL